MRPPALTVTDPVALKATMPPEVPFQAFAVKDPPVMVTSVHWGTRWTITRCAANEAPSYDFVTADCRFKVVPLGTEAISRNS
jgi:hypothetical protein